MDGLYKVAEVDRAEGLLHLRAAGDRRFRVRLGPKALTGFVVGMKVHLRRTESGGLVLETTTPGRLASAGGREGTTERGHRRRDRRAVPRVRFDGQTTITVGAKTIQCSAHDLSEGGISLRLPKYEQLEDPLELAFKLPNSHRLLKIAGVVARVGRTSSEAVWGVGFCGVTEHAAAALQSFVAASADSSKTGSQPQSRMDRSLASLYEDAVAGLEEDPSSL